MRMIFCLSGLPYFPDVATAHFQNIDPEEPKGLSEYASRAFFSAARSVIVAGGAAGSTVIPEIRRFSGEGYKLVVNFLDG